jgi:hypothetical protein
MTSEQVRQVWNTTPFRPFTLRMTDGRAFRIPHREFLSLAPVGRTLIVHHEDGNFSILDLLLATEITVETDQPAVGSNGAS